MQNKKTILGLAGFVVFLVVWYGVKVYLFPHPADTQPKVGGETRTTLPQFVDSNEVLGLAVGPGIKFAPVDKDVMLGLGVGPGIKAARAEAARAGLGLAAGPFLAAARAQGPRKAPPIVLPPVKKSRQIELGNKDPNSKYHIDVILDARGAAVRFVLLNKFQAVDKVGQPEWEDPETKKVKKLLVLVPEDPLGALSNVLCHFDPKNADKDTLEPEKAHPLPTLGDADWDIVEPAAGAAVDAGPVQRVVFRKQVGGVVVQKTYTLTEGEYHLGLEVKLFKADPTDKGNLWFRYQLAGAHGLPIEGQWYTGTFRNALIAQVENGSVYREIYDARTLAVKDGGDENERAPGRVIRYAAVTIQYFTSAIVVDDQQPKQDYLSRARATLETTTVKGTVRSVSIDGTTFVLSVKDRPDLTLNVLPGLPEFPLVPGSEIGVLYRTDNRGRSVVAKFQPAAKTQALWENDVTVRVATEPINLKDATEEQPVVHKYLLYNGPMKPVLLGHMQEPAAVSDALVNRYTNDLNLNTLVDYHSPGFMGSIADKIGLSWVLIKVTNVMHLVLGMLSWTGLPLGLCIIVLTVLVRGMMFPVSRKAAMTNIRMQELQPEIKKLKEKHKDDPQALNVAIWGLQRKSGINPLSTCWLMALQMPVFMGLYYSLQESIHFRAVQFWPTWIHNLAAPDMLFYWGESIPFISTPESYGAFWYLGPYFNIMPVIAVTLMIFQQKYTMPPPTDEQQEMQQKMMKYMMVFMGLMFYKVPSGLVLYFIASSIWGFCERKLLPKKKKPTDGTGPAVEPKEGFLHNLLNKPAAKTGNTGVVVTPPATGVTNTNGNAKPKAEGKGRNRGKQGKNKRKNGPGPTTQPASSPTENGSLFQRLLDWWRGRRARMSEAWEKLQEEAQKKNRL